MKRFITLTASVFLLGALAPVVRAVAPDDWPMWNYDAAQSGMTPVQLPGELHLQWVRRLPAPRRAWLPQMDDRDKLEFDLSYAPVVMGGLIFVPSMVSDSVTAYRVEDGAEAWRHYADGPVRLAPAAWDGRVYFVSDDGHLYCLDAATGERLWRFRAAPGGQLVLGNSRVISMWAARGAPVVLEGKVYFAAGVWPFMGTFVYALDAATGEVIWQNTGESANWQRQPHGGASSFAGIAPQGYLAAAGDRLVVSGGRSTPALLDRHTGRLIYLDIFGQRVGGYRIASDGEFFYNHGRKHNLTDGAPAGDGVLVNEALAARAAELAGRLDSPVFATLAARGRLFLTTISGSLYCFGAAAPAAGPVTHDDVSAAVEGRARALAALPPAGPRATAVLERAAALGGGYALVLGVGDGALVERLALRTDLHIVGIDPDEEKIAALRRRFDDAGLYGTRIALLAGSAGEIRYPPYISSLIVAGDSEAAGLARGEVYELLRPYGGTAFVGPETVLVREGPLPGAGEWTHQYADSARSAVSRDDLVRLPLGVLWYGSVSNNNVLPRHAVGPRPQAAGGRLAILGVETLSARDVYTGRELWVREFPGIGHPFTNLELEAQWRGGAPVYMSNIPGAAYIGSPYVTLADSIYLRHRGRIHRLDPANGETLAEFPLYPAGAEIGPGDWGPVLVRENLLVTTIGPDQFDDTALGWLESWNSTSSRQLLVMDRFSGETLWKREAGVGFRHNALALAGGRLYAIDGLSETALEFLARRGARPAKNSRVMALDARDGRVLWETESGVFGTYLAYSEEHDILLESGSRDTRRPLPDEPSRVVARRGANGDVLWTGGLQFPAAIRGEMLIPARPGAILNLLSGEPMTGAHPITGEQAAESYWKSYGCGAANASTHLLLFRSGAAGFADLEHGSGTGNFGGFKSGCTASMIAADGVLNAPDYTRTCSCSYQNQTSLGLVHTPWADVWTGARFGRGRGPVRRIGVNLGAPGNRRADSGTVWVPFPPAGVPSPGLEIRVETVGAERPPATVTRVSASTAGENAGNTLDDDPASGWQVTSGRDGRWNAWIEYELSEPAVLDRVAIDWTVPENTRFEILAGLDPADLSVVFGRSDARGGSDTFEFEPVRARCLRILLHNYDKEERAAADIRRVRLGGLPFPAAYRHFVPPPGIFRRHPMLVDDDRGLNWVTASGISGLAELVLDGIDGQDQPYTVTLHFLEPEAAAPGERVFDVAVQGRTRATGFDVAAAAGGAGRAVTFSVPGVRLGRDLSIGFQSAPGAKYPPVLSGVEIVRE